MQQSTTEPRPVTRGEIPPKAFPDTVHCTFLDDSPDGPLTRLREIFQGYLPALEVDAVSKERGLHGFKYSGDIKSRDELLAKVLWGGASQRGKASIQVKGFACGLLSGSQIAAILYCLPGATLKRVDLAVDFLGGEVAVLDAPIAYKAGEFDPDQGPRPMASCRGDWDPHLGMGRTYYVGSGDTKLCRVYEKGKQLGQRESEHVRVEVQFGAKDRVLPFRMLTDCDRFFSGAYPFCSRVLPGGSERIATQRAVLNATIDTMLANIRHQFGASIGHCLRVMTQVYDGDISRAEHELLKIITRAGTPKRLLPSAITSGVHNYVYVPTEAGF